MEAVSYSLAPVLQLSKRKPFSMPVIEVDGDLDKHLSSAGGKLVVVDFFAEWCGPCRAIAPVYRELSDEFPDVVFLTVNEAHNRQLVTGAGVRGFPTFHFMVRGEKVDEVVGGNPSALREKIEQHRASAAPAFGGQGVSLGGGGGPSLSAADAREARLRRLQGGNGGSGETCDPATGVCGPSAAAGGGGGGNAASPEAQALRQTMVEELEFDPAMVDAAIAAGCEDPSAVVEYVAAHEGEAPPAPAPAPASAPAPAQDSAAAAPAAATAQEPAPATGSGSADGSGAAAAASGGDAAAAAVTAAATAEAEDNAEVDKQLAAEEAAAPEGTQPLTEEQRAAKRDELKKRLTDARKAREEGEKKAALEREAKRREEGKKLIKMRDEVEQKQRKRDLELRRREEKEAANAKARARRQLLVDKYERLVEKCRREGAQPPTLQTYLDSGGKIKRAGQTMEDVRAEEEKNKPGPAERAQGAIKRLLEHTAGGGGVRALKTCRILINNALEKDDPKYRSVKLDNKKIKSDVVQLIGGLSLLHAAGFHKNAEARTLDISPSAEKETLRKVRDLVDDALRTAA